jgi:hypothetical protein
VIDDGVQVAFDFFALALLVVFFSAVLFGLVRFVRDFVG